MPNIFDHVSLTPLFEMNDWPRSTTHKEWLAISRSIIQDTIADINFDPAVEAEVSEAFTGSGLLRITPPQQIHRKLDNQGIQRCRDGVE